MIINRYKRWVVITPPKTGSQTLNRLLTVRQFGGELFYERWHHNTNVPDWAKGFDVYLSVRNPFARASSLFRHQWRDPYLTDPLRSFHQWVEHCLFNRSCCEFYWQTLLDWWPYEATPIRLEYGGADLELLHPEGCYIIPVEGSDPKLEHWTTAYERDPQAIDLVTSWAKLDLERFGYSWS